MVLGDYSAFESIRDNYESWYDLLGGWVMYTAPWTRKYELADFAHACAGMRTRMARVKHLDMTILALCEFNLHQVISITLFKKKEENLLLAHGSHMVVQQAV